jgi:Zn-dependent M16 (insulinase) family peptidase
LDSSTDIRYIVDRPYVVVIGKPSATLAEKLEQDEKARLATQREKLGPDGLAKAERELEAAKVEHEKPIPTEVLTSFPVPDVKSISWIPVQSVQEPGKGRSTTVQNSGRSQLSKHIQSDGAPLSMFVQYDHVKVKVSCSHSYCDAQDREVRLRCRTFLLLFGKAAS